MKKYWSLLLVFALLSCNKQTGSGEEEGDISETRANVKTEAAASYSEPVADKDKLNNWKFAVEAFETPMTFKYLLKIQYKELSVEDTLLIPDFGIQPVVEMKKGPEDLSCIIGFKGKENEFKEYKKVVVEDGELKITALKSYRKAVKK